MIAPSPPSQGDGVLPWARAVTAYLRSLIPSSGPGIRIQHTPAGMAISATIPPRSVAPAPPLHPWQAYSVPYVGQGPTPEDQWKKFRVSPGMVNNLGPENPNEIFTATNNAPFYLEVNIGRAAGIMDIVPLSATVKMGTPGSKLTTDSEGIPIKANLALGAIGVNESTKTVTFTAYRNTSLALYCVQTRDSCEESHYSMVFIAG